MIPAPRPSKRAVLDLPVPVLVLIAFVGSSCFMALVVLAIHWLADFLARTVA